MTQIEYLQTITSAIQQNIVLPKNEVVSPIFKKLKIFHINMLWEQSIERSNIYYENIFSEYLPQKDLNKTISLLVKNLSTTKKFFEHMFQKYKNVYITQQQESIVKFDVDYFPVLFPKTVFTAPKITLSLYHLFQDHEKNKDKIHFIIENQKKNYLPYNPDMYYLMLFFSYMKENSEDCRRRYNPETKKFYYIPSQITSEFLSISKIIYENFDNIFDIIKPKTIKNTYQGQSFDNIIINEKDFGFFIDFVASYYQKEKIEKKLVSPIKKEKIRKI